MIIRDIPSLNLNLKNYLILAANVERVIHTLTRQEEKVLRLRFGINSNKYTVKEIAAKFDLSRERIYQIERKSFRKLRHYSRVKALMRIPIAA